jgi:hypothetical protein
MFGLANVIEKVVSASSAHRVQAILPAAARGRAGGRGAAGWKRPCDFPILTHPVPDFTIGIIACIGFPIVSTKFSLLRNYAFSQTLASCLKNVRILLANPNGEETGPQAEAL